MRKPYPNQLVAAYPWMPLLADEPAPAAASADPHYGSACLDMFGDARWRDDDSVRVRSWHEPFAPESGHPGRG